MTTITREQLIKRAQARLEMMQEVAREFSESPNAQMDFRLAEIALASLDAGSNSHPAHGALSNDRLHRIREILGKAAAQRDGGNLGYAMSDAVKALDELLEVRKAEPVAFINGAWTLVYYRPPKEAGLKIGDKLYTAPPAPVDNTFILKNLDRALGVVGVALPESKEEFNFQIERWIQRLIDRVIRYSDEFKEQPAPVVPEEMTMADAIMEIDVKDADRWTGRIGFQKGWNACRAAMLNGGKS
uniref:Eaa protein n=1 Tax=Citrobacter koseri TaxID=545 RepID=UPI00374CACCE